MATYTPAYRLSIFAARSVDVTETTVMTPPAGAPHALPFKVASVKNLAGFQPYLNAPVGRRGRIDPLNKTVDTGSFTFELLDMRTNREGGNNVDRFVTAFIGDSLGANALIGRLVLVEESLDYNEATGAGTWATWWTGRVSETRLNGRLKYELAIRDRADDLDVDVFCGRVHASAVYPAGHPLAGERYAQMANFSPIGLPFPYGDLLVTAAFRDTGVLGTGDVRTLNIDARANTPDAHVGWQSEIVTGDFVHAYWHDHNGVPSNERQMRAITREADGILREYDVYGAFWQQRLRSVTIAQIPGGAALPAFNTALDWWIVPFRYDPRETLPMLLRDVHPARLWRHLLDGYFGGLNDDGSVRWSIPYDAAAFDALEAIPAVVPARGPVTGRQRLNEWLEAKICQPNHWGYRFDEQGRVVPFSLRRDNSAAAFALTNADLLRTGDAPAWSQSRDDAVTAVEIHYYADRELATSAYPPKDDTGGFTELAAADVVLNALALEEPDEFVLTLQDFGPRSVDVKQHVLKVDATLLRFRASTTEDGASSEMLNGQDRRKVIESYLREFAGELKAPYGLGATYSVLHCRRSSAAAAAVREGMKGTIDVDEIPDPATYRRGGPRRVICVGRTTTKLAITLEFLDIGSSAIAAVPVLGAPAQTAADALHSIDVPVTLNAQGERVRIDYATVPIGAARPAETDALWTHAREVIASGTTTLSGLTAGMRHWVRARTQPLASQSGRQPSAWVFPASGTGYADTASVTNPYGAAASSVTESSATLTWTNGTSDELLELFLHVGGAAPAAWTSAHRVAVLLAGTTQHQLSGLSGPTVQHTIGLRHVASDGTPLSPMHVFTFTTGASAPVAPAPTGVGIGVLVLEEPI